MGREWKPTQEVCREWVGREVEIRLGRTQDPEPVVQEGYNRVPERHQVDRHKSQKDRIEWKKAAYARLTNATYSAQQTFTAVGRPAGRRFFVRQNERPARCLSATVHAPLRM